MLKINLKLKNGTNTSEIPIYDIIFSENFEIVTFVAEDDGLLESEDTIQMYSYAYDKWSDLNVHVDRFNVLGTFYCDTKYQVYSDISSECKYIRFHDNRYYYNNEFSGKTYIFVDDVPYEIETDETHNIEFVKIREKYLITADTQTLTDGTKCDIFIERVIKEDDSIDTSGSFIALENGEIVSGNSIEIFSYPKPFINIVFKNNNATILDIEDASCADNIGYVIYDGVSYDLQGSERKYVMIGNGLSGAVTQYIVSYDYERNKTTYTECIPPITGPFPYDTYSSGVTLMVKMNDSENSVLPIRYRLADADVGESLYLYLANTNVALEPYDRIIATTTTSNLRYILFVKHLTIDENGNNKYIDCIFHNGRFYEKQETDADGNPFYYVTIGEIEYQYHFLSPEEASECGYQGYIDYGEERKYLNISQSIGEVLSDYRSKKPSGDESTITLDFANVRPIGNSGVSYSQVSGEVICNSTEVRKYNINTYFDGSLHTFAYVPYDRLLTRKLFNGISEDIIIENPIYGISRYDIVDIDGTKYKIYNSKHIYGKEESDDEHIYQYIMLDKNETYVLSVDSIEGSNRILCTPIVDGYVDVELETFDEQEEVMREICYDIATNFSSYEFMIENTFSPYKEQINFGLFNADSSKQPLRLKDIKLFKTTDYFVIPVAASQENYASLFQEDNLERQFVNTEIGKSINEYVDMEKDIYYPYHKVDEDKLSVNGIYFNLHFRTRTLENWKINEDYTRLYGKNNDETIFPSYNEIRTNWFCFDYYSGNTNNSSYDDEGRTKKETNGLYDIDKNPSEAWKHSDLLYFLNYTDDDVYYQKKKLSRSFLRLMFYDSDNPSSQSLLYQATIWYDSNKAYKKFIDNNRINLYYNFNSNEESVRVGIKTSCEPFSSTTSGVTDGLFTFDDNIRLDSQFYVRNRYEMESSAEGFYLYLFKNLLDGVCKRTIYMKVMFNHAGEGKSCLFMLPHSTKLGDIVPWEYNEENVNKLKEGVPISEVFQHIYIPITLEYDVEKDQYQYYLSENTALFDENHNLTFNLFEIKMKDESNQEENNP